MDYRTKIKDYIGDRDMKQKTLAKQVHLTESTLSNYLTGRTDMPIDVLAEIASYLDITADYLLGLADEPERPFPVSANERRLLEGFRTLSREQKELIAQNVELMVRQNRR